MTDNDRFEFDRRMMAIALRIAERGLGNVAPNPAVGAVIADEATGEVIARGWTQPGGRPHAETEAIRRAGPRARGATMYVTLEPCSHHGRTPPCADAIIASGVKRVVAAIEDPDPRVAGRGLDRLREAGIEVTSRIGAREADWLTKGHILRVSERRPMVWVKMAMSATGDVPRGDRGNPTWVTGPEARAHGHLLRAMSDAILVGRGTLADDDPELTCRLPGLESRTPRPIILAGRTLPPPSGRLMARARANHAWLFATAAALQQTGPRQALEEIGCTLTGVADMQGRLWLPAVMEALVAAGVTRLLVEGGPEIWRSFFAAGLVDAVAQYVAPPRNDTLDTTGKPLDDSSENTANAAAALKTYAGRQSFGLIDQRRIGNDRLYVYRRKHSAHET